MNKAFKGRVRAYLMNKMYVELIAFISIGASIMVGNEVINVIRIVDDNCLIAGKRVRYSDL